MYRVYFDGIEQNEKDIININDVAEFSIIREDGFNSTEQIIREKTEMELQFCGASYSYICEKINTDRCAEVEFRIEDDESGLSYDGTIPVTLVELDLGRRIGKTKIKDTSFSAFIRDYLSVQVSLFEKKTRNCLTLDSIDLFIKMFKTHDNNTDYISIIAFDVLDVFKKLVSYHTDNTIDVVSTYLTTNKYAITTGFNLHNHSSVTDDVYPKISIEDLFKELRKKLRLYMSIEYDYANRPYLRIEQEDYFFSNTTPLFNISDIPTGAVQTYDINRNYNIVEVGSDITDSANVYYENEKYTSWIKESYSDCGTCTGNKDAKLDLVSGYIISSNVIYQSLNAGSSDDDNDSSIFLFSYANGIGTRDLVGGEYIYNYNLINEDVLSNWGEYLGKCIAIKRYPLDGFLAIQQPYEPYIPGGSFTSCFLDIVDFNTVNYDTNAVVKYTSGSTLYISDRLCGSDGTTSIPSAFRYFEAPQSGTYNIKASVFGIIQKDQLSLNPVMDYRLKIVIYTDDTFSTISSQYNFDELGKSSKVATDIIGQTGDITMTTGQCAVIIFSLHSATALPSVNIYFSTDMFNFTLDTTGQCESVEYNDQNSKPFIVSLDYPLCYNDYLLAKENKQGYVMLADKRFWIKELNYKHNRLSNLKLMGNYPVCGC